MSSDRGLSEERLRPFFFARRALDHLAGVLPLELAIVRPGVHGHMSMVDSLHSRICLFCACGCL